MEYKNAKDLLYLWNCQVLSILSDSQYLYLIRFNRSKNFSRN